MRILRCRAQTRLIQRRVFHARVERAAADHEDVAAQCLNEIARPARHRGHAAPLGQGNAENGHRFEIAPLDKCVDELCSTNHYRADIRAGALPTIHEPADDLDDATADILGRRRLGAGEYVLSAHEDGIGVGPANIDADPDRLRHSTLPRWENERCSATYVAIATTSESTAVTPESENPSPPAATPASQASRLSTRH